MMKTTAIIMLAAVMLFGASTAVQAGSTYKPRTGDASLDASLGDLNVHTHGDSMPEFIDNISLSYNIPRVRIENWVYEVKMVPADVVMTVLIAKLLGIDVDVVVNKYKARRGKGWGVIAKELGIKPGSKEFHALKNGAFGELEKAKKKGKSKGNKGKKGKNSGSKGKNKNK